MPKLPTDERGHGKQKVAQGQRHTRACAHGCSKSRQDPYEIRNRDFLSQAEEGDVYTCSLYLEMYHPQENDFKTTATPQKAALSQSFPITVHSPFVESTSF